MRPLVSKHSPHLLLQHVGVFQFSLSGCVDQFVIGKIAPQEEGQARRQLEIANPIGFARFGAGRRGLGAENKFRMRKNELQRLLDAVLKVAGLAADVIEIHQRIDVGFGERPAVSLARHGAENRARASQFFGFGARRVRRRAGQDLSAAGRVLWKHAVDRPLDSDLTHLRGLHDAFDRIVIEDAAPVRAVQEQMRDIRVRDEGQPNGVLAGL